MLLVVAITLFAHAHAWGRGDLEKYGPFQVALHSKLIKCEHGKDLNLDVSGVDVYFYDFPRNDVESFTIDAAADGILKIPQLDKTKKFIIFVPGYKSNINKKTEELVRDTFRNFPNSYLIILDHSPYTNDNQGYVKSYERSVKYVYYIGKALADFLADLARGGISPKNIHCIGHSLGAQMLGQTGQLFFEKTGTKIAKITGLDPAGPCFSNSFTQDQIRSGVADYVDVYHCNAGGLGTTSVLADTDFFVNRKGQSQPNCGTPLIPGIFDSSKAAKCSHRACIELYTATVSNPNWFLAWRCDEYKQFKKGECSTNEVTIAGFWNPGNATGVFYFSTDGYNLD
ncbi:lipase member H-like [Aricia agestis]|uniref:lipase member H-like n=1 Tax=Aricia agestis TaxID=91739 RepID=UPI001C207A1E|nr:lipase member H-like [Aricia agestis]